MKWGTMMGINSTPLANEQTSQDYPRNILFTTKTSKSKLVSSDDRNEVYICPGTNNPLLYSHQFEIQESGIHWINTDGKEEFSQSDEIFHVKTRYNQTEEVPCQFISKNKIKLLKPIRAITGRIFYF
jgi:hypothetical protein